MRPGAKLHGRLTKNAYSNSDSSYECLRKSPEQHIGIQQNIAAGYCVSACSVCVSRYTAHLKKTYTQCFGTIYYYTHTAPACLLYPSRRAAEYRRVKCETSEKLHRCVKRTGQCLKEDIYHTFWKNIEPVPTIIIMYF